MKVYRPAKPVYVVYIESRAIPNYYHKELADAYHEAFRLANLTQKNAYIIEYGPKPIVLGCMPPGEQKAAS